MESNRLTNLVSWLRISAAGSLDPHVGQAADAIEALENRIAELEAEVRFSYLECEDLVKNYYWEDDVYGDASALIENMRHSIKIIRDIAIPNERYLRINADDSAWQRMLAARGNE